MPETELKKKYYKNRQLQDEVNFIMDKPEGMYNKYNPQGRLIETTTYKNGQEIDHKEFD